MDNLILYLSSLVLGGAGAWLITRWGGGFGLLDKACDRSSHEGVVPKGGGVGILAAFLLSSWLLGLPILFWMSAGLISLLSLYGDRREISPKIRLIIQFIASIGLLSGLFFWEGRGGTVYLLIPFFSIFMTGTANYYNFMDGINGIAGITGGVGFGLISFFAVFSGNSESIANLSVCMGLACLGFLPFNLPKAQVFMGDVGSVLLGFVYAALVVGLSDSLNDFLVLCMFMFPFYADELTTLYVRIKKEYPLIKNNQMAGLINSLMRPHRKHLYQLLANEMRIEHWKISLGYGVLQIVVGIGALVLGRYGNLMVLFFGGGCFVGVMILSHIVRGKIGENY